MMFQDIEVKPLFEGQIHECYQFSLNIEGYNYQGIFHNEEIQWFHPHPKNKLGEDELDEVESKFYDKMTNHDHPEFELKPIFKDQIHERYQFSLNIEGYNYQGIFHNEEIQWFHPHPKNKLGEDELDEVESKFYDKMTNHDQPEVELKPIFKDQVHERYQFTLNIEGYNYHGIFHDEEIQWFHPHPKNKLEKDDLDEIESKVYHTIAINKPN
ncbi:hypothetical protein BGM26_06780 [Bacillus sp. FJAT-29790]|uniref:hypothetical protein n=1 Tax=Bacillus sp. FJAT-29790 TaxID=1895002 RepID=UPI001C235D3C|nr:hypothetical protein [Bacillus sp. FJAT-29790]MBU8878694.1 hypothetical protein [Bacillus sp. FJAT-29790]